MDATLGLLALGLPVVLLVGYAWLTRRALRRGVGSSFLTPFQDMWDPAAGRVETALYAEAETAAPAPTDPLVPGSRRPTPA